MNNVSSQQLAADLKAIIKDAEAVLKGLGSDAGVQLGAVRERLQGSLQTARVRLANAEDAVIARSRAAAERTDKYVHDNPWPAIGVAAVVGLLIGLLSTRK